MRRRVFRDTSRSLSESAGRYLTRTARASPLAAVHGFSGPRDDPFDDALDKFLVRHRYSLKQMVAGTAAVARARLSHIPLGDSSHVVSLARPFARRPYRWAGRRKSAVFHYSSRRQPPETLFECSPLAAALLTHRPRLQFTHAGADSLQVRTHSVPGTRNQVGNPLYRRPRLARSRLCVAAS